ncbi:gem-associated protein 8-like [Euwallacea similis]|uniref:gem-associated protein 8-like n=1 Tax=Euwallacea similis TaxID=1736056 RepID=UPI00344C6434
MDDKLTDLRDKLKKRHFESSVSSKIIQKKYKKSSKNYNRRNRRKRSRKTYLAMLKGERLRRGAEDLCNKVQEFNVIDMDMAPLCDFDKLPVEVSEWQQKEQIAYWKSRSISLEIENKMLRQHLRDIYAQQVNYYEKNKTWQQKPSTSFSTEVESQDSGVTDEQEPSTSLGKLKVLPKEPEGKNRLKNMEKIYGNHAAKIMGMETAIQLNYERLVEDNSPRYWP